MKQHIKTPNISPLERQHSTAKKNLQAQKQLDKKKRVKKSPEAIKGV